MLRILLILYSILMATYERNYITQAILQLDFDPIATQKFITFLWENVGKEWFSHVWNQQEVRHDDIQVSDDSFSRKINKWFIWVCDDRNGKKMQITSNTFTVVFDGEYKSQKVITEEFEFINKFLEFFKIEYINRFLVRYINIFKASDFNEAKEWDRSKFINTNLLSNIKVGKDIWEVRQTLCDTTVALEDYFLWLRYWIWNRFNPNPIVDWDFVLDIAVRSENPIEIQDINMWNLFKKYKDSLNQVFESSITKSMRNLLIPIN